MPAANQDASRNSCPVRTRSALRVRIRSGSASSTSAPAGSRSVSSSSSAPPTSAGISDSMPSAGMPSARRSSSSRRAGLFSWARASAAARADRLGEQQLAAAGRVQLVDRGDRALVGDGERAQLAHLVAPELDAHGVLGGRREDVDDAAADGELAAGGDHLDAGVGQLDEPDQQLVEVVLVADPQRHRVEPAQAGRDRLDQAARGGDDDARRGVRVGEPGGRSQAAADGVRARREPLVRQRLPARAARRRRPRRAGRRRRRRDPRPHGRWR